MEEEAERRTLEEVVEKRFLKYTFFKVAREWRFLDRSDREEGRRRVPRRSQGARNVELQFFSLVGIRGDADFMILASSTDLDPFQGLVSSLRSRGWGGTSRPLTPTSR